MKDDYPFHLLPSFFIYSNSINLDIKLSIIQALAQDDLRKKTYYVQRFLNQFAKRRHSIQEYKIIQSRFLFQPKDNQLILEKDFIQIEDLIFSKFIVFYQIIQPIQ